MELVDTPDLGSGICEFKSRQGYLGDVEVIIKRFVGNERNKFYKKVSCPLGETVDAVALKAPSFGVSVQVRQRVLQGKHGVENVTTVK